MTKADAIKLGILVFLIFILCLPEFFPQVPQIHFLCETIDPCTLENVCQVCGKANPQCVAEMRNSSSQDRPTGWYLCKTEMDSHGFNNNTSVSGQHVLVVLTLKGDNNSEWNVSVFINHTDLYTEPQNPRRLFYCFLAPNKSKCPDMTTEERTKENSLQRPAASTLKTTTSAKPVTSSLKKEKSSTQKLNCQLPNSGYLFHYQENNHTARSAAFSRTQKKHESWWSVTTGVWIILVLTVVMVALTSVGCLVYKNRRKSHLVTVSARSHQLKEISKQSGNLTRNAPDAFTECSVDDNVFLDMTSAEDRAHENLFMVNVPYNRQLSPIYEITENLQGEDCDEGEEEEEADDLVTKQEFKESQGLSGQTSAHLHRRSNLSCSCHETDGEL